MYPGAYHAAEHHWRRDPAMGEFYLPGKHFVFEGLLSSVT